MGKCEEGGEVWLEEEAHWGPGPEGSVSLPPPLITLRFLPTRREQRLLRHLPSAMMLCLKASRLRIEISTDREPT